MDAKKVVPRNLVFLWHMHQPSYLDKNGISQMPWVFLHCIKDYYDMPWILSLYPSLKATFNITPTLISQIKQYEKEGFKKDKFLSLWIKKPESLNDKEKSYVQKICKSPQFETMVKEFERFVELYKLNDFSENEFVDLEVLFLLSWCGNYLRENSKIIKNFIKKGRDFNQEDKKELLKELMEFIPKILPFYKKLLENKQISLSTTPYNHPILPLLFDMKNAKVSNPETVLPREYMSLEEDAKKQVDKAIELYEEVFDQKPSGFWPAEGAVDEKSVKFYKKREIKWIATDEAILYETLDKTDNELKYGRYRHNGVFIGFRDHALSDLIGFTYRYKEAKAASEDFIKKIEEKNDGNTLFVILDGENAWEFYKNNAKDFFTNLYKGLSTSKYIKTSTFDEVSTLKAQELSSLHPGSWIYGNFDTWVGHSEKNRAWELLYQTKRDMKRCKLSDDINEVVQEHFLAAECSDWYWWYGEDHFSDFLSEFDILFRSHLIDIYNLCNLKIPSNLLLPIQKERDIRSSLVKPKFDIDVTIDGKKSSFYEWLGSGMVDENRIFSTMQGSEVAMKKLYYGENEKYLYIRIDGNIKKILNDCNELKIHFKESDKIITIPIKTHFNDRFINMSIQDFIEIQIDKKICGYKNQSMQVELIDKDKNSEFIPIFGDVRVCDNEYEKNWFV